MLLHGRALAAQAGLPHVQRLHDRAAQRVAVGLLSARQLLQAFPDDGAVGCGKGEEMKIETTSQRERSREGKIQGIAAALLPYEVDGRVAVDAFSQHLQLTHRSGLMNAVNMDTGYVNYLSDAEKRKCCAGLARRSGRMCRSSRARTSRTKSAMTLWRSIAGRWTRLSTSAAFRSCSRPRGCTENLGKRKWRLIAPRAPDIRTCSLSNLAECSPPTAKSSTKTPCGC